MIHGPFYQFECEDCGMMSDVCHDTLGIAKLEQAEHDCIAYLERMAVPSNYPPKFRVHVEKINAV